MSSKNAYAMLIGLGLTLSACTRSPQSVQVEPAKQPTDSSNQQQGQGQATGNGDQGEVVNGSSQGDGEVGITLQKQALQQYAVNLDNLNYNFTYLDAKQSEKITFDAAGKAQLKFTNLPSDKAGTVTLEVLDGTTVKLRGSVENVTLKAGENTSVSLVLKEVDGGGGGNGTTDLTIDVTLDNTPASGGAGNGAGSGSGAGTGSGSGSDEPNTGGNGGGTVDPIASWDGKSNLGNAKWSVSPAIVGAALH